MLTIGVLGGMGPAASVDFLRHLVAGADAGRDQDHPPCLLYNATQVPDRTTHLLAGGPDPTAALQQAARLLEEGGADLIAIPCNSAHAYLGAIQEVVAIPVLDMIALTGARVAARFGPGAGVGILAASATVRLGLYSRQLDAAGLVPLAPSDARQDDVMAAIRAIKAGARGRDPRLALAIDELVDAGADIVVLACTELPLAVDRDAAPVPFMDATEILAWAALESAGVGLREALE